MDPTPAPSGPAVAMPKVYALSELEVRPELVGLADLMIAVTNGNDAPPAGNNTIRALIPGTEFPSREETTVMRAGVQVTLAAAGSLGPDQLVVVQCRSGIGRGPALAWAIMVQMGMGVEEAYRCLEQQRPQVRPNRAVLYLADDLLGLDGQLAMVGARVHRNYRERLSRTLRGEQLMPGCLLDPPAPWSQTWS